MVAELKKLRMCQEELKNPHDAIGLHPEEEPDKVLHVANGEIQAPKYVTAIERERQAWLAAEAARRNKSNKDNLGLRGLRVMMNGTLEVAALAPHEQALAKAATDDEDDHVRSAAAELLAKLRAGN